MKYEEPNMQILLLNNEDLVRTSGVQAGSGVPEKDTQTWPTS